MTNGSPPKETTFDALSFQDSMKLLESFKLPGAHFADGERRFHTMVSSYFARW
jgi:hypothetical protein